MKYKENSNQNNMIYLGKEAYKEKLKEESQGRTKQFSDTEGIGMRPRGFALGDE